MNEHRQFAIMLKPVSNRCNLDCTYCYYLRNTKPQKTMSSAVLERSIKEIVSIHGIKAPIEFAWHGGEPLLAGLEFFKAAVKFEKEFCSGRTILNTLQTNGVLLDDEFCAFFAENKFLIGISLDGPASLHNFYRKDKCGNDSFEHTMRGLALLKKHGVDYNLLATIHARTAKHPKEVYGFLREHADYMQFLPVVECLASTSESGEGLRLAVPQGMNAPFFKRKTAPFTVEAEDFGNFLITVFDEWMEKDCGKKFVNLFEAAIGGMGGRPCGICSGEAVCGHSMTIEATGDVYACDRYVYSQYRLGNIQSTPLLQMAENNKEFGLYKFHSLPEECLSCRYLKLCFAGCPKDRIRDAKSYLCQGYKAFFQHLSAKIRGGVSSYKQSDARNPLR